MRGGFLDCRLCRVIEREHADIVPAVEGQGHAGLAHHLHGPARRPEMLVLRDVQDLGQARIFVTAQRRIDHVVGDDARLIVRVSDAAQRAFGEIACVRDAQADTAGPHDDCLHGAGIRSRASLYALPSDFR